MNLGIYPANNSMTFGAGKNINKKMSSIDVAYERELAKIRHEKLDRQLEYLLRAETPMERAKNKIYIILSGEPVNNK